jgi:hypothetical protein
MKRKILFPLIFLVVAAMVFGVYQLSSQAQAPGGRAQGGMPQGGQMMQMFSSEAEWAYVSFELGVTDPKLLECRKAFQESYTKGKALREKMGTARGDTDALRALKTESDTIKTTLDKKLKTVLTTEQTTKIAAWEKETRDRMRARQAAGGGQPGGGTQRQGRGNQ